MICFSICAATVLIRARPWPLTRFAVLATPYPPTPGTLLLSANLGGNLFGRFLGIKRSNTYRIAVSSPSPGGWIADATANRNHRSSADIQQGLRRTPYLLDALCSPGCDQIGNTLFADCNNSVNDDLVLRIPVGARTVLPFNGNEGGWYARIP